MSSFITVSSEKLVFFEPGFGLGIDSYDTDGSIVLLSTSSISRILSSYALLTSDSLLPNSESISAMTLLT